MHHTSEDIHEAAAAVDGAIQRQNSTHIPVYLTKSQKEWAKVRGVVKVMGALHRVSPSEGKKDAKGAHDTTPASEEPLKSKAM